MKLTKPLIFISGFVAGVVYCLYRDVLSKPVEPKVVKHNLVMRYESALPDWLEPADYLDDTQPVYVGEPEEVGAWQLEQFAKESE